MKKARRRRIEPEWSSQTGSSDGTNARALISLIYIVR